MYFGFSANPPAGNGIWSQQDVWEIWVEEFEGQYELVGSATLDERQAMIDRARAFASAAPTA